jgi:formylglycine-generating enzyme required for sulfatase activity
VVTDGYENHPVTGITWHGAMAFARAAGKRLPTEEEWEKAVRGVDGRTYPWGQVFIADMCNTVESGIGATTPVGKYGDASKSVYGCEDSVGNVREWTASSWLKGEEAIVVRSGSWRRDGDFVGCAFRDYDYPYYRASDLGFRCVREV